MSVTTETVSEYTYRGERYVSRGIAAHGEPQTLHRVAQSRLRAALRGEGGPEALAALLDAADTITVTAGDPELTALPPLLPTDGGHSLVSGFLGTHKSKADAIVQHGDQPPLPKWYFKGLGSWLRTPGQPLVAPAEPVIVIEEAEVVLVFVNDENGEPHYAGYTFGNDFCDIGLHRIDPGYTPSGKLCDTAVSPHLFLGEPPRAATGQVTIERDGRPAWKGTFDCGADALWFRTSDLVDRLFSFPALRRPGLVNYVLTGADLSSFHDGFQIADGDHVVIDVASHGVVLSNTIRFGGSTASF
ncbi:fumarylacetoacetate (FAA) hydrolase [Streptacidiphilus melanogenes]|uniref:fumarylacetoacetate (FAA) hydrolase n=1 Tax=Streptacidiphilus melanogenes TaxID=411235 RepID=UPI0005AB86EC|nr:fumarylacetoacetate (FAA) hydrolase [Streptacidiphilus melanogenes]